MSGAAWRIVSGEHRGAWLYMRDDGKADLVRPLTDDQRAELMAHLEPVARALYEDQERRRRPHLQLL